MLSPEGKTSLENYAYQTTTIKVGVDFFDKFVNSLSKRFLVKHGSPSSTSSTGENYIELCSCGEKNEGESVKAVFLTQDDAARAWIREFEAYAHNKKGSTLYWRCLPEMSSWTLRDGEQDRIFYKVRGRLLISKLDDLKCGERYKRLIDEYGRTWLDAEFYKICRMIGIDALKLRHEDKIEPSKYG